MPRGVCGTQCPSLGSTKNTALQVLAAQGERDGADLQLTSQTKICHLRAGLWEGNTETSSPIQQQCEEEAPAGASSSVSGSVWGHYDLVLLETPKTQKLALYRAPRD